MRISLADDNAAARRMLAKLLTALGHTVVSEAGDGAELVEHILALEPDLALVDVMMPKLDGIDAAREIWRQRPTPTVLISGHDDAHHIARAHSECFFEFLLKPAGLQALEICIHLAVTRFRQFEALRREAADLREALESRKTIERAKHALMLRCAVDEPTAFARLQKAASDQRMKLAEVARQVLLVEGLLE